MNIIPEITDEKLALLAEKIHPLIYKGGQLMRIRIPDLRKIAFNWSPEFMEPATGLTPFKHIRTLHGYAHPVCFKPSVAEVLAQIPEELVERTVAFSTSYVDHHGESHASLAMQAGFHMAETTLYALESAAQKEEKHCTKCDIKANWNTADCPICLSDLEDYTPMSDELTGHCVCHSTYEDNVVPRSKAVEMEKLLLKFMELTSPWDNGLTMMAHLDGRVKFYKRMRVLNEEAERILTLTIE